MDIAQYMYMHAHTNICMYTLVYTNMHTHIRIYTHKHICTHICTCMHARTHTHQTNSTRGQHIIYDQTAKPFNV